MTDKPVELDEHRGMAAQKSTETRRRLRELGETARAQAHQIAEQERRNAAQRSPAAASLPPPRS